LKAKEKDDGEKEVEQSPVYKAVERLGNPGLSPEEQL